MVKIDLGMHIDGYIAVVAHTVVCGTDEAAPISGRQADAMQVTHILCRPLPRRHAVIVRLINPNLAWVRGG